MRATAVKQVRVTTHARWRINKRSKMRSMTSHSGSTNEDLVPGSRANGPMTPDRIYCGPCRRLGQIGTNLEATGTFVPVKAPPPGRKAGQGTKRSKWFGDKFVQYRCIDCGYVGWSQHKDAARLLQEWHDWLADMRRLQGDHP